MAYVLQVFPKYSETFIVNELLEHQRQGRPVRILSLRFPREGRFHGCLAELQQAAEYLPESVWDNFSKVREASWQALKSSPRAFARCAGDWALGDSTLRDVWQAALLKRWAIRRNVRHIHCHFGGFAAGVAALCRGLGGPTYSVTLHAHEIFRNAVNRTQLRNVIGRAAFVVTVSRFNAEHLTHEIGADPAKIRVLYNGIPLQRFVGRDAQREPKTILAVGRLIEKKGFVHLIRACRTLADQDLLTRCDIVGEGREKDTLAAEIKRLNLSGIVHLVGSWPQEKVADALGRASLFVLPCVRAADGNMDALPTVLLEAMAGGCPIVSTSLSGIPEIIEHEESGLLVPPENSEALAHAAADLLLRRDRADALASAARKRADQLFNVEHNVAVLGEWLEQAARQGHEAATSPVAPAKARLASETMA